MPKLDADAAEFRAAGHRLIDWVADYLEQIEDYPVLPDVKPGDVEKRFPAAPDESGRGYDELIADFERKIVTANTHWNHPGFFAWFAITGSQAGILGELLTAALNSNGMLWKSSPAMTELETVTLRWLREALGLPPALFFGIINDTASVNSYLALAAAREALGASIRVEGMPGRDLPTITMYCSEHAHVSMEKAAVALGIGQKNMVKIASDGQHRMRVDALEEAIARDRAAGKLPCAVIATAGTTSTAAIDPVRAIGAIAQREKLWLHVDAAYAGSSTICPEFRHLWDGIEYADSVVTNPHKWLFTPIDCSVLYTRNPGALRAAFALAETPAYLTTTDAADINYMDFGLSMGRRFRALKLWMVLEHYGLERLRGVIRDHVAWAKRFAEEIEKRDDAELLAPHAFSLVVFRKVVRNAAGTIDDGASEQATLGLADRLNATGKVFVSTTRLRGVLGIRLAIGNGATEWRHVDRILDSVKENG